MHRIDTSGNVNNRFHPGNPATGQQATLIDQDWLNAVQEEIVNVILGANIDLEKGTNNQLAAAIVNQLADGRVVARSAGSTPASDVHPHVRSLLTEIEGEQEAETAFPKPLTDDAVRAADVVVTMGCGDVCPIIPGVRYEDWEVGDPALASIEGVEAIRDDISARVRTLLDSLTTH